MIIDYNTPLIKCQYIYKNTVRFPTVFLILFPYSNKYHIAADAFYLLPFYAVELNLLKKAMRLRHKNTAHLTAGNVDLDIANVAKTTAVTGIYDLFSDKLGIFNGRQSTFYHSSMQISPPVPSLTIRSRVSPSFFLAS